MSDAASPATDTPAAVPTAQRRELDLKTLDAVIADARNLLEQGYEQAGAWNLAQVCRHIAAPMRLAMDGYNFKAPWIQRTVTRLFFKKRFFRQRTIPTGLPAPPGTEFGVDDEAGAVAELEQTVERFKAHTGPLSPHPYFGELTRDEHVDFNTIHCSHHLSFLVPKA